MKKILFAVLLALVSLTTALAEENVVQYTSKVTGITLQVPANCKLFQDDVEALILQTPDKMFTLTAEPFNVEKATQDDITAHLQEMGEAAGMDLSASDKINNTNTYTTLIGLGYDFENGAAAVVGVAVVNETELGFYITVVAGPDYTDYAATSLVSIDFDPDSVED